jgi:sensor c-di-GMP phosphodiesterase-like protein
MMTLTKADIVRGLRNREFPLYYQPKASLVTNRIVGADALARWQRPGGSPMMPGASLPAVGHFKLMNQFTLQLLPQFLEVSITVLGTDLRVSFNVTAEDFHDDKLGSAIRTWIP